MLSHIPPNFGQTLGFMLGIGSYENGGKKWNYTAVILKSTPPWYGNSSTVMFGNNTVNRNLEKKSFYSNYLI